MTTTEATVHRDPPATKPGRSVRDRLLEPNRNFSNSEMKAVRALLANYPAAGLTTVSKLAKQAGVSDPTVLRLAQRLGFEGFAEMQEALLAEVEAHMRSPLTLPTAPPSRKKPNAYQAFFAETLSPVRGSGAGDGDRGLRARRGAAHRSAHGDPLPRRPLQPLPRRDPAALPASPARWHKAARRHGGGPRGRDRLARQAPRAGGVRLPPLPDRRGAICVGSLGARRPRHPLHRPVGLTRSPNSPMSSSPRPPPPPRPSTRW